MPAIDIRPANSGDLSTLIQFVHTCDTTHVWQMDSSADHGQIEVRFREIRLPRSLRLEYPRKPEDLADNWTKHQLLLVARLQSQLVGYLTLNIVNENNLGRVIDLVVDEGFRRQGIATALLVSTQDWLRSKGLSKIMLEMQSKNHSAISLARKLRYEFSGYADGYFANRDLAVFFTTNLK